MDEKLTPEQRKQLDDVQARYDDIRARLIALGFFREEDIAKLEADAREIAEEIWKRKKP